MVAPAEFARVAVQRCRDYSAGEIEPALEAAIALIGGWDEHVAPGKKVLLKPNLIAPRRPEEAACTHPEVLRALIRALKRRGCVVSVGDSAGGAIAGLAPTAQALKVSGWADVCEQEGAELINFDAAGAAAVPSRTGRIVREFYIARPVLEADVVINVPKLKTHSNGGYTGAVKNTFGCIPGLRKAEYHRIAPTLDDFGELIADIHLACRVSLNVLDGIVGMEGAGPTNGSPKHAGILAVSVDALALDVVAAQMIGLDPGRLEILQAARTLGVGQGDPAKIEVVGLAGGLPRVDFALPASVTKQRKMPRWLLPAVIGFFRTRPQLDPAACRKCGLCRESCPVEAIDAGYRIDRERCIDCLCCQELCPQGAVKLVRVNPVARALMPPERMMRRWDAAAGKRGGRP